MDFSTDSSTLDAIIQEDESVDHPQSSSSSSEDSITSVASSLSSNFQSVLRPLTSTSKSTQPIEILDTDEENERPSKRMRQSSSGQ